MVEKVLKLYHPVEVIKLIYSHSLKTNHHNSIINNCNHRIDHTLTIHHHLFLSKFLLIDHKHHINILEAQ